MTRVLPKDARAFIKANTALIAPPHVPEITLHLADEAHELWHRTEEELGEIGLEPPFWAFAWAGGQGLARFILDNPSLVEGKRIVDFASGSGLVAIAAAKAGAAHVIANDIDPFCSPAIELNAETNGLAIDVIVADLLGERMDGVDMVLAGDVFFDRAMSARVAHWFDMLVTGGADVIIGDPGRHYLPLDRLDALATYEVPVTRVLEDAEVKKTTVWRFRAPV